MVSKKLELNKPLVLEDCILNAEINRMGVEISWRSTKELANQEWIRFNFKELHEETDDYSVHVVVCKATNDTMFCSDNLIIKKSHFKNRAPINLLKYRTLFEGLHKNIDSLLNAYDNGAFRNILDYSYS